MAKSQTAGLANIARSNRKARAPKSSPAPSTAPPASMADDLPLIEFSGQIKRTSVALDSGVWEAVQDWAHLLTKRVRKTGRGSRVVPKYLLTAALLSFHEKSLEEQLELVRQVLP